MLFSISEMMHDQAHNSIRSLFYKANVRTCTVNMVHGTITHNPLHLVDLTNLSTTEPSCGPQ
jgi:hypothetical protein